MTLSIYIYRPRILQDVFAKSVDGMGLQTLEAGEKELNRLRKLKLEKMGDLVRASRARIQGTEKIKDRHMQ